MRELSQLQKIMQQPDFGYKLNVVAEFLPNHNKMKQILRPTEIRVGQFGPSSFLSCPGLL